jgi:hypothetical protein
MQPLNVLALVILVSLLSVAATLELFGALRSAAYLRDLLRRQPPDELSEQLKAAKRRAESPRRGRAERRAAPC